MKFLCTIVYANKKRKIIGGWVECILKKELEPGLCKK
jgi:hypothetical protein